MEIAARDRLELEGFIGKLRETEVVRAIGNKVVGVHRQLDVTQVIYNRSRQAG